MEIRFDSKFTDKHLDKVISKIYTNLKSNFRDIYVFDLTNVEYIGNQELLVLSALFKSFVEAKIKFKVLFFHEGISASELDTRVKRQMIEIWEVWKIWQTVPPDMCRECFGIDDKFINYLKKELNYYPEKSKSYEIYNRNGVTPFIRLDFVNNYSEKGIQQIIEPIYRLNSAIEDLLQENKCFHPFASNSLSTIITEELYLNFLDHSLDSSIPKFPQMAFMSISFRRKFDESEKTSKEIQFLKEINFESECLEETFDFFYDHIKKKYKNESYIEFSFLDFGSGITNTLREQFLNEFKTSNSENLESNILKHSFSHNTSRHPIYHEKNVVDQFIPRGLFDVLTIVRRYKGLLIVRSNFGKILFDFSVDDDIDNAFSYFGNNKQFFPGTLLSFYIPAIEDVSKLDSTSIKPPEAVFSKVKSTNKKYVNIHTIVEKLNVPKERLYSALRQELRRETWDSNNHSLVFISFKGCKIDKRIIKKTLYFLLTDYEINNRNNVVILNSPPKDIINDIALEILSISSALRNYKLHPLPLIDFDENSKDLNVKWLGIYNDDDKEKLNALLYNQHSLAKSDFNDPANIVGHLHSFDSYGNLISNFPNKDNIIEFYRIENDLITAKQIEDLVVKHECIKKDDNRSLYLCSGNYYQKEYVELNNLVNDKNDCQIISNLLYSKLESEIENFADFNFIGITSTSDKILKSLELQNLISKDSYTSIDASHTFENDLHEGNIDSSKKYILVCHVISSGFLTDKLNERLKELGTSIEYVAVIVSILDPEFETTKLFIKNYENRLFSLYKYPISKLLGNEVIDDLFSEDLFSKEIIRINPHTNIPIRLSINQTKFEETVVFGSKTSYIHQKNEIIIENKFLDSISEDTIRVGFLKFNNVIHPYFFKTEEILPELSNELLETVFKAIEKTRLDKGQFKTEKVRVFYPRKSGIEYFDFRQLKTVLKNEDIEEIEIERFETAEGWKFPHNSDFLKAKVEDNICFIFDDGSCSGDSLIQMIDEISFYNAKEIVLLCIIGRVKNHKREFFSRLTSIKVNSNEVIPLSIYFVSHWHIPTYYLDENPNLRETAWLNDIISLQNTPRSIKEIAKSVRNEILPKEKDDFADHKYLPKTKDTKKTPKKELLLVREELGKVIGYRLYKESFDFFNNFIRKYSQEKKLQNHYKEIELLCATFIYEPYLYEKITKVLPDVVEEIERFVRILLSDKEIDKNLTYAWSKKDIIHLFFIVFRDKKLIDELKGEIFEKLISFTKKDKSDSNPIALYYILYKLLVYFPLNPNQFKEKKFDKEIKELIGGLITSKLVNNTETRKFLNFISSLPYEKDFKYQISELQTGYENQRIPEFHEEGKSFNHNVTEVIVTIREVIIKLKNKTPVTDDEIRIIKKSWAKIFEFVNPILSFSRSFNDFITPFFIVTDKINSLGLKIGEVEEILLSNKESILDIENLEMVKKNIDSIQLDFELNSLFHQIIESPQTDLSYFISALEEEFQSRSFSIFDKENLPEISIAKINIPRVYVDKLLVKELGVNMTKYCKANSHSQIELDYDTTVENQFTLQITNKTFKDNSQFSNGRGTESLLLMSDCNIFDFKYKYKNLGQSFIQTLIFKVQ
ncbi:MAG TPA: hypothetical protein PKE69_03270 [Pyrinomonadaceae bacterium]|nr:hypothetical protein [Pyrinomonadaceae bacterium]